MKNCLWLVLFSLLSMFRPDMCVVAEEIRIGAIYSLSGYGAIAGKSELNAVQMALEEINSKGGIGGKPIRLVVEDNNSTLKETVSAFNKLVNVDKVPVILGPNWAEFSEIAAPLAQKKKVVMLTASGYSHNLVKNRDFVFTMFPAYMVSAEPLIKHILANHRDKSFAAIRTSNAYMEGIYEAMVGRLEEAKVKIPIKETARQGETDFRSFILKLKKEGIDAAIPLLLEGGDLASFLKQAKQQDYKGSIFSYDFTFDEAILNDMKIAEGAVLFKYHADMPKDLEERYRKKFKMEPIVTVSIAYDSVYLLADIFKRCGIDSTHIRDCLAKSNFQGVSGKIGFDPDGNPAYPRTVSKLYKVEDGKFKPYSG